MDALSEILRDARLVGGVFLNGEFTEPWRVRTAVTAADCSPHLGRTDHFVLFHFVIEGRLTVRMAETEPLRFSPGQAVIFPHNDRHTLSGDRRAETVSAADVTTIPAPGELMAIRHGGGGAVTRIVCGFLGGALIAGDPLFSALPPLLRYDCATERSGALVRASFELAASETAHARPGSDAMLARLSEFLFIEAVRAHIAAADADGEGLLQALQDRGLSRAIALIHRHPERSWTVEDLAGASGASRSSLNQKFPRHLGRAPAEYLNAHRMRLAARALDAGHSAMGAIAEAVGYGSEAAFSRAFKRFHGVPPSQWRK